MPFILGPHRRTGPFLAALEPAGLVTVLPERRVGGSISGRKDGSPSDPEVILLPRPVPRYSAFDSAPNRIRDVNWLIFQKHAALRDVNQAQE